MKVVVREAAAGDLDDILDWISRDNPRAAAELVRRILARIDRLAFRVSLTSVGRGWSKERANSWKRRTSLSTWWTSQRTRLRCSPSFMVRGIAADELRSFLLSQKCLERFNRRCGCSKQTPGS